MLQISKPLSKLEVSKAQCRVHVLLLVIGPRSCKVPLLCMYAEPVEPGGQGGYKRLQILAELEAKPVSSKDLVFLLDPPRFSDLPPALYVREKAKVIYPKYSKQWVQ